MSSLSKTLGLSSSLKEEIMMVVPKKQGIVSILGSDVERTTTKSLRRTLSADMSSKKWQAQHGFYPLKKIASSEQFPVSNMADSSSSEGEEDGEDRPKEAEPGGQLDIWSSIQQDKKKKELENPGQFDIWSSILAQKAKEDNKDVQPYVHPLVKRSASSLNEKSLEICTESLGSETGSDCLSSYSPSETSDTEEDKVVEEEERKERVAQFKCDMVEEFQVPKYNLAAAANGKKSQQRSFPPPISSLSSRDGASLHMKSRRDNGRLVLEAVSVASQNNFRAQRQDGRLVLTFVHTAATQEEVADEEEERAEKEMEQFDVEIENSEDEKEYEQDEEEAEEEEIEEGVEEAENERGAGKGEFVMEERPNLSSGFINVHRLATKLTMNKPTALHNTNPTWSSKFNDMAKFGEEREVVEPITPATQSLPLRPTVVARMIHSPQATVAATGKAAASFNACEYFWKSKPMTASSVLYPSAQKPISLGTNKNNLVLSKNLTPNEQQELVVLKGSKGNYLVPLSKSCKEPRKPLLFREPHCIATS